MVALLDALANAGPRNGLYERMAHWASPDAWQLVLAVKDQGLERGSPQGMDSAPDGTPLSRLVAASFQVRFPRDDVDELIDRMRRHNRGETVALGRPTWRSIDVPDEG